jgi:hypothetical protein
MDLQRVIAWAQNKLAGFYGATAFIYAVDPEAILQTTLLHSWVSICLARFCGFLEPEIMNEQI